MMSETLVAAILQASLTGAGLIIIILTLFISVKERVFRRRINELNTAEFFLLVEQHEATKNAAEEKIRREHENYSRQIIADRSELPAYLGRSMEFSFIAFILSIMLCALWTLNENDYSLFPYIGLWSFLAGVVGLFVVGLLIYCDIIKVLKTEYNAAKKPKPLASLNV